MIENLILLYPEPILMGMARDTVPYPKPECLQVQNRIPSLAKKTKSLHCGDDTNVKTRHISPAITGPPP